MDDARMLGRDQRRERRQGRRVARSRRETVVVTGLGATTPLGPDVASTWTAMLAGQSGLQTPTQEWATAMGVAALAPLVKDPVTALDRREARTLDRNQQVALVAAREAWQDAGAPDVDPCRLAVVIGSGVGGLLTLVGQVAAYEAGGVRRMSPHGVPMLMPNGAAAAVGLDLGARGGIHAPTSACASGAEALAVAVGMLRSGQVDVVVAGGAEAAIHPVTVGGFAAMRALSTRTGPAEHASRPFDRDRDGFVLGEGGAVLVLERQGFADARGVRGYATVAGAAITSDALSMVRPDPLGTMASQAISGALMDAGAGPEDVAHISAHATSTPLGDRAEHAALVRALGTRLPDTPVSAVKSLSGHLLGASGALSAVAAALTVRDGTAPVTRNLHALEDGIDLDVVTEPGRRLRPGVALCNSFGFGGHNVALAFTSR